MRYYIGQDEKHEAIGFLVSIMVANEEGTGCCHSEEIIPDEAFAWWEKYKQDDKVRREQERVEIFEKCEQLRVRNESVPRFS